jgi:hypothetical protein
MTVKVAIAVVVAIVCAASMVSLRAADGPGFAPPPSVAGQSAWIPLHFQHQETNLCVPTSASIILDYFGDEISPREIKELSLGKRYSPDKPFNDFTITLFRDLNDGLKRRGYAWREKITWMIGRGFGTAWQTLSVRWMAESP